MNDIENKEGTEVEDDLKPHYDFDYSRAKPNRFAEKYKQMVVHVGLAPDVAEQFPTEESVNDALRDYLRITRQNSSDSRTA